MHRFDPKFLYGTHISALSQMHFPKLYTKYQQHLNSCKTSIYHPQRPLTWDAMKNCCKSISFFTDTSELLMSQHICEACVQALPRKKTNPRPSQEN